MLRVTHLWVLIACTDRIVYHGSMPCVLHLLVQAAYVLWNHGHLLEQALRPNFTLLFSHACTLGRLAGMAMISMCAMRGATWRRRFSS